MGQVFDALYFYKGDIKRAGIALNISTQTINKRLDNSGMKKWANFICKIKDIGNFIKKIQGV